MTRIPSFLLRSVCVAAVVFGMSAPSSACWFPFCWHSRSSYRPVYYGPVYAPGFGSGCSPCGTGGCGVQSYYAPSPCGCATCGCSPCSAGCGANCGVSYVPDANPVPDDPADAGSSGRQTFANEESADTDTGTNSDEADTAPGDDDFGPVEREESESTEGTDPFPEFEQPVLPIETGDDEGVDPQPLNLDEEGVTMRVTPIRERIRAEARYRVPNMARLEVVPDSPWHPVRELPTQVASN